MLTYDLKKSPGVPLYEALYRCIRGDILSGALAPGEKLPSKRALAANLDVSKITVETAYGQLLAEGYLRAVEKVGYFVENVERLPRGPEPVPMPEPVPEPEPAGGPARFPFSVWSRLQREVMLDYGEKLLRAMPPQGISELREAIAHHLADFRGMRVDPGNILVGAGTDFLYNLLIQLLGRDKVYAVEEPGYEKIWRIYGAGGVRCVGAPMDGQGVRPDGLGDAQVLHISPSHHFPTGLVTPMARRQALLEWAAGGADRWIIEDDYDSEFRPNGKPLPTLFSIDACERVIYMNTFSKSLTPTIRISYMILPVHLANRFYSQLSFYACTVSTFEQYTLAAFIRNGYFEKHINRMRLYYSRQRKRLIESIEKSPIREHCRIIENQSGLHFRIRLDTELSDEAVSRALAEKGIKIQAISEYYLTDEKPDAHDFIINYSDVDVKAMPAVWETMNLILGGENK